MTVAAGVAGIVGKSASSFMLGSGALSYFAFSEMLNFGKAGLDVMGSTVDGAWNKSEDKFRQSGEAIGHGIGAAAMVYPNVQMLLHDQSKYGQWFDGKFESATEAKMHGGKYYEELKDGGYREATLGKGKATFGKQLAHDNPLLTTLKGKDVKSGILRTAGGSTKYLAGEASGIGTFLKGIRPFAIAMGVGWAAKSVLGFAGGIIDEAMKDEHRFRNIHYDSRFFNTQEDQMTNYQQLGSAMNNYQNRMTSTARVYHSR